MDIKNIRLTDEVLTAIFRKYRQYQYNQPENQASDINEVFKMMEQRNIHIKKELSLFLITFKNRLTHIISESYGIDVVAYKPDYISTLLILNNGNYFLISEHIKNGKRIVRRVF